MVGILSLLCEGNDLAVDRVHKEDVIKQIIKYLDSVKYGRDVAIASAQLLTTVTEDQGNTDYSEELKNEILLKLPLIDDEPLLKTLFLMILFNINQQLFSTGIYVLVY